MFTHADAGTLYQVKGEVLTFEITHNDTFGSRDSRWYGGMNIPPVPLDKKNGAGFAAITGEILNIEDVYLDAEYHFEGPKTYDKLTGYRTQSVAINNVRLIEEMRQLSAQMVQSERMASVGILAAGIVHNLRNPLMTVMGFGELIQQMHPDIHGIDEIVASSHRMSEMIEDILTKSRQRKTPEEVDFNLLINRELDFMNSDATFKHKVEKIIELADELPLFECVYTDFSQTVGNLMRNALDAMHDRDESTLTVRSLLQDAHIVIEVGDTGLGLYMIARLMEPYEAKITFDSQVDVGTTFRLEIPLERPPVPELPEDIEGSGERP